MSTISTSSSTSKAAKPKFWDKVKEKIHIGHSEKESRARTPKRETDLQEEARRTFAQPPEARSRRHSVDVPLKTLHDFSSPSAPATVETSAMPGVPVPRDEQHLVGPLKAPSPGEVVAPLPDPLLRTRAQPPTMLAFKPLLERRTTGSTLLAASGAGLSIDSPAPPRAAERMPAPVGSVYAPADAAGLMLPPTSFTPARRANGPDAAVGDADYTPSSRRHSLPATAALLPVSSSVSPYVTPIAAPLSPPATYALPPPPPPVVPSQSTPQLPPVEVIHYSAAGQRSGSPRLRLVPSPRHSPPPSAAESAPPRTSASPTHDRKRAKYVWRQKMRSVNAQIVYAATAKRAAYDETAEERAVAVRRAVEERAQRAAALRTSVSQAAAPESAASPAAAAAPVASAAPAVSAAPAASYTSAALLWGWFLLSYFLFGLQLLSVAAKETCEALATVFELISLGLSRVATDAHVRANFKTPQLSQAT